jgi:hydroxyethylthiazole kinase-like uncharacterized protein yjeF
MKINELVLLTPAEMARVDRATIATSISGIDLMQAAGKAVAQAIQRRWSERPVLVLCGPGNNGGDGFVAARHLSALGWPVRLALLGSRAALSGDAAHHAALWSGTIEPFTSGLLNQNNSIVIDAIFGAGLSRPVDGSALEMINALIESKAEICAIDVPSGVDGATGALLGAAAPATLTVTFFRKKPGHLIYPGRSLCGELVVADIGIGDTVLGGISAHTWENNPALWRDVYPWPRLDGHKYERGHAVILGGAAITGASRMTALGCMRIGAGVVTLAAPQAAWAIYATALTSVIVHAIEDVDDFKMLLNDRRCNVIAIGPGAGANQNTRQAVLAALATGRDVVLDADALTVFAESPTTLFEAITPGTCVLTPHEGEFARLFNTSGDKLTRARQAAALSGAVVVLKGSDTIIAEPGGRAVINSNAPADLATAGSGDVLTGFIAGLLAQGVDPFNAACAAVWLHGAVATAFGPGLIAEDLPDGLPAVLKNLKALWNNNDRTC